MCLYKRLRTRTSANMHLPRLLICLCDCGVNQLLAVILPTTYQQTFWALQFKLEWLMLDLNLCYVPQSQNDPFALFYQECPFALLYKKCPIALWYQKCPFVLQYQECCLWLVIPKMPLCTAIPIMLPLISDTKNAPLHCNFNMPLLHSLHSKCPFGTAIANAPFALQ